MRVSSPIFSTLTVISPISAWVPATTLSPAGAVPLLQCNIQFVEPGAIRSCNHQGAACGPWFTGYYPVKTFHLGSQGSQNGRLMLSALYAEWIFDVLCYAVMNRHEFPKVPCINQVPWKETCSRAPIQRMRSPGD